MVLYRNTLKYMFSMVQANWPIRPRSSKVAQRRAEDGFIGKTSLLVGEFPFAAIIAQRALPLNGQFDKNRWE